MNRIVGGLLLIGLAAEFVLRVVAIVRDPALARPLERGGPAPDFHLLDLDGQRVALSELRGEVVLLSFWATWCEPCRVEMPMLANLQSQLGGRGLRVLAINQEESKETVVDFVKRRGLDLRVLLDSRGEVGDAYGRQNLPYGVLVDREGRVRGAMLGARSESRLRAWIEKAL